MSGNTFGALKAKLTKHYQEDIRYWTELDQERYQKEYENNKVIWYLTLDYLKSLDNEWEIWYDTPVVPEKIIWHGEEFQNVLKILWQRIWYVKSEKSKSIKS